MKSKITHWEKYLRQDKGLISLISKLYLKIGKKSFKNEQII